MLGPAVWEGCFDLHGEDINDFGLNSRFEQGSRMRPVGEAKTVKPSCNPYSSTRFRIPGCEVDSQQANSEGMDSFHGGPLIFRSAPSNIEHTHCRAMI